MIEWADTAETLLENFAVFLNDHILLMAVVLMIPATIVISSIIKRWVDACTWKD